MNNAVAVKDHLLNMLNLASLERDALVEFCETVLCPVLENTEGLWLELGYAYKAAEIAERAMKEFDHYIGTCQHHKTHEKLAKLRDRLRKLWDRYYLIHHQQKTEQHAALGLHYLSNVELSA